MIDYAPVRLFYFPCYNRGAYTRAALILERRLFQLRVKTLRGI